jgi:excisionase family DNA binding protein
VSPQHEATVDVAEMARVLSVSPDTVYRWARSGVIPALKIGNRWRFIVTEVLESVRQQAEPHPDPWHQSPRTAAAKQGWERRWARERGEF